MRRGFEDFPSQGRSLRVRRRVLFGRLGQLGQSGQFELDRTGFAIRGDMQIGKEVMPVRTGLEIRKLQSLTIRSQDKILAESLSCQEQPDGIGARAGPPGRRIDLCDDQTIIERLRIGLGILRRFGSAWCLGLGLHLHGHLHGHDQASDQQKQFLQAADPWAQGPIFLRHENLGTYGDATDAQKPTGPIILDAVGEPNNLADSLPPSLPLAITP